LEGNIFSCILFGILIVSNPENNNLGFADFLYSKGDYFRAITEYKRFIFVSADTANKFRARKQILNSYKCAGRYEDALLYLNTFKDSDYKNMQKGKVFLLMNSTEMARNHFTEIKSDTSILLIGWSYILDNDWKKTVCVLDSCHCCSDIMDVSKKIVQYAHLADKRIETKSEVVSGLFSMLIPGAGRFYTKRAGDGLFSFFTVAIPGVISYVYWQNDRKRAAAISIALTSLFYVGNIYGSVVSAQIFNEVSREEYILKVENELRIKDRFTK